MSKEFDRTKPYALNMRRASVSGNAEFEYLIQYANEQLGPGVKCCLHKDEHAVGWRYPACRDPGATIFITGNVTDPEKIISSYDERNIALAHIY